MRRIRETSRNSAGSTKGHEGDQHNKGHWYKGQNTVIIISAEDQVLNTIKKLF